jgi:hypothetical protein
MIRYLQDVGYTKKSYGAFYKDATVRGYRIKMSCPDNKGEAKVELEKVLSTGGFNYSVEYRGFEKYWLCVIVPYGG